MRSTPLFSYLPFESPKAKDVGTQHLGLFTPKIGENQFLPKGISSDAQLKLFRLRCVTVIVSAVIPVNTLDAAASVVPPTTVSEIVPPLSEILGL